MNARLLLPLYGLMVANIAFADISYNYVEVGYGVVAVDVPAPLDGDGDGPQLLVSHELIGPFKAFLGASQTDFDKDNLKLDDLTIGLGWHHALGKNASTFLDVSYRYTDIENTGFPSYDQDGYGVTLGYRAENHSPFEFLGTIDYINVESGIEFGGGISLLYDVTRRFSASGGVSYFDNSASAHLGVRYFFDLKH